MFDGWKEMDAYMRENNIVGMPSLITEPAPAEAANPAGADPNGHTDSTHKS